MRNSDTEQSSKRCDSSDSLRLSGELTGRHTAWLHVSANELDDAVHGSAWLKNGCDAGLLESVHVLVGDNAANDQQHVVHMVLLEEVEHAWHDGVVCARQDAEADHVNIFLQ